MKFPWFKQKDLLFMPSSFAGWVVLFAGLIYAVYSFLHIDSRSHSASDTLRNFFFRLILIGVVYSLIAYLTSRKD